jgi:hypothetical protein
MPEKDIHNWQMMVGAIASFLAMMGFNYKWIQNATKKDCVLKPDCKEDRQLLLDEIRLMRKESREDFKQLHKRIDKGHNGNN